MNKKLPGPTSPGAAPQMQVLKMKVFVSTGSYKKPTGGFANC